MPPRFLLGNVSLRCHAFARLRGNASTVKGRQKVILSNDVTKYQLLLGAPALYHLARHNKEHMSNNDHQERCIVSQYLFQLDHSLIELNHSPGRLNHSPGRFNHSPDRLSHSPGRLSHRSLLRRRCIAAASSLRRRRVAISRESVLTWRLPFYDERPREVPDDGGVVILVGIWRREAGGVVVAPEVEKRDEWASPPHRKRRDVMRSH